MRVLILSCKTGGGHNAAGAAIQEALEREGHEAVFFDYLTLVGKRTSNLVGDIYVDVVKGAPKVFGCAYHLAMFVSRVAKKSPVYYANGIMGKYLARYLEKNPFDAIVMPHLYPAETLSYMKKKGVKLPFTMAVMTDYTCIPFWEETDCDCYIAPHKELVEECVKRGIPREKLIPIGIPVSAQFTQKITKGEARGKLGLSKEKKLHLIIGGSMGAGKIVKLTASVLKKNKEDSQLVVICGSNEKLKKTLDEKYEKEEFVRIVGHTDKMYLYTKASDVVYTKPGGLSSTETAVSRTPMIHTFPIPGCETKNRKFFVAHGMSLSGKTVSGLALMGRKLLDSPELQKRMKKCQARNVRQDTAAEIVRILEEKVQKT